MSACLKIQRSILQHIVSKNDVLRIFTKIRSILPEMDKGYLIVVVAVIVIIVALLSILVNTGLLTGNAFGRSLTEALAKSEIVYQASTRFLYSLDGGETYRETIQQIPVNSTYYLSIEMQVSQSEPTKEEKTVVATITIPSTTILHYELDDHPGVSLTGREDAVTKSRSYDIHVVAGVSPAKFRVTFECKPLMEGSIGVEVVYDDLVSPNWDATGVIRYVSDQQEEETEPDTETVKEQEEETEPGTETVKEQEEETEPDTETVNEQEEETEPDTETVKEQEEETKPGTETVMEQEEASIGDKNKTKGIEEETVNDEEAA